MSSHTQQSSLHIENMTEGAPARAILKFAVPLILGYLRPSVLEITTKCGTM